jgi:hypothetical protein
MLVLEYLVQLVFVYLLVPLFIFLDPTLSSGALGETVVQDLLDIVNHAIEHPLDGDFDLPPQGKTV